jgi:hypothetical protein
MPVANFTDSNGQTYHLGRKPPIPGLPKLRLAYYVDLDATGEPPDSLDLTDKAADSIRRMYLNDQYGDCVIAGKFHTAGMMTGEDTGTPLVGEDKEVLGHYHRICGSGDNGCVITEVLDDMQAGRFTVGGKKASVDAYAAVDNKNTKLAKVAMNLFGPLTLGIDLPNAWTGNSQIWDVTNTQIVGGHDVCTAGYDSQYVLISSWGKIYKMTWAAFNSTKWVGEVWALLSPLWYGDDSVAPGGVKLDKLKADFDLLKQGRIPEIDPPAVFYDFGTLA